jgi:hypothetical protein
MSLSERVAELKGGKLILRRVRLPASLKLESSYDRANARFDQVNPIRATDYEALLKKLADLGRSGDLSKLSLREMRLSASCLFDGETRLADNKVFLNHFLEAQRSIRSAAAIRRLIHAYCTHFDSSHSAIRLIGMFLREAVGNIPATKKWAWRERDRRFELFDPTKAPDRLAELIVDSPSPRKQLEDIGLSGQLMVSGLAANIFLSTLKLTQQRLSTDPKIEDVNRIIDWVQAGNDGMYYSAYRSAVANALLLPWIDKTPDVALRQTIQSFLLEKLSDPRIDGGAWLGSEEAAREVITRWLAQATLEQFLKVVDRVAAKHQWEYRRAFWNAYIERGVVSNAWVAFGSAGASVARRIAETTGEDLMRRFATLGGSGADQAVLLLNVGDLVIADWSHDGRLRIWRRGNQSAPEFNQQSYLATDLRADSDFDAVHNPPDGWQAKAEAFIRRHTDIRMLPVDYMPGRIRR